MWARVVEIMTAIWLAFSPFIFRSEELGSILLVDQLLALLICTLAGISYWNPTRHAHLLIIVVSCGLVAWGRFAVTPPPPIHQNHIVVGLFLLMIALIPNEASRPPRAWRRQPE